MFGRRIIKPSRVTILATSITPILLTIAAVAYSLLNQEAVQKPGLNAADILMQVGAGLVAAAFISSVVFASIRKWEIAKGTGFGSGIGMVIWLIAFGIVSGAYS